MKSSKSFPFERARRVTTSEVESARKAIEQKLGSPRPTRPGRPPKLPGEKTSQISIRLSPEVIDWAKRGAEEDGIGYQTFINRKLESLALKSVPVKTATRWTAKKSATRVRKKRSS